MKKPSPTIASRLSAAVALAALLALPWAPGFAQDADTPVPQDTTTDPNGISTQEPPPRPLEYSNAPVQLLNPGNTKVEISGLGGTEGDAVGTLDTGNGGFDASLWSGSSRSTVNALIQKLPATTLPSLRELERRLLLTRADAPVGDATHAFQTVRLRKMLELGLVDQAGAIALKASVPNDAEFARVQADALLYAGPFACSDATATRMTSAEPFWIELRAYCYAKAGDSDALELTQNVMSEQGLSDPMFDALFADLQNHTSDPPPDVEKPTALHVLLLKELGLPISERLGRTLGMPVDLLAFKDEHNSQDARFDIAERLVEAGAYTFADLKAFADKAQFSEDDEGDAEVAAQKMTFFKGQSLLRRAGARMQDEDTRSRIVAAALHWGAQFRRLPLAAQMQSDIAILINPFPQLKGYAQEIGFGLLFTNEPSHAAEWATTLDEDKDAQLYARFHTLLNLFPTSPDQQKIAFKSLEWLADEADSRHPEGGETTREIAAVVFGAYDVLGESVPPDIEKDYAAITQHLSVGRSIPPALLKSIEAARGNPARKGEALASILAAIGPQGPSDMSPDALVTLMRAVRDTAGVAAARAFAVEVMTLYEPQLPPPPPAQ